MATTLSEISDITMMQITDYRLITLYNTSVPDFENYFEAWLKFAIFDFNICDQDLIYDDTTKTFSIDLASYNKIVLATLIVKYWAQKNVNDITQQNLHVTDRDYKIASEAQNLREKVAYLNVMKEQCSQMLIDYGYRKNTDWSNWNSQQFGLE